MKGSGKKQNKFFAQLLFAFSAALLTVLLTQEFLFTVDPLKQLELKLIDLRFSERGEVDLGDSSNVIILEINQDTYDQIPPPDNRWPWPRYILANAIENLTEAGVKAIGIDINLPGPDQFSPVNDSLMRAAIKKSGLVVLAGKVNTNLENLLQENLTSITKIDNDYDNIFYGVDSSLGIVQPPPDYDLVFRRYLPYLASDAGSNLIPSFGFAILNKYYGLKNNAVAERIEKYFRLGKRFIPQFDKHSVLINFYGPDRTFPHMQLMDVLDDSDFNTIDEIDTGEEINMWDNPEYGLLRTGRFKDKIVIIGSTMPEDRDLIATSFAKGKQKGDNIMYGVEFHANIIQNVISGDFLHNQSKAVEILIIVALSLSAFFISSFVRRIKFKLGFIVEIINLVLLAAAIYALYSVSVSLFINNKIVIALVGPFIAIILGYFTSTAYHFISERQQNVMIKGMFSQYVSRNVVNELIADPNKLRLGGEKKNLTILFSDIAGFTTFSEKKEPEVLVSIINEFLSEMSEIIITNEGTLDKYLGDAVMAFWGAPLEVEDHAFKACTTALQMQERLAQLRQKWLSSGEAPLYIRIGINTGEVIVGNIGGAKRFDYTVLGDNVNLASRLEGANKEYGTNIMIGETTYKMIKNKFHARELDVIKVKGKTEPTKVYELISLIGDKKADDAIEEMFLYNQGLELYRLKSFESAMDYFTRSFEKLNDYPSKVYMNRCKYYIENPPDENWNGVFEFKNK